MSFLFRCILGFVLLCMLVGAAGQFAQSAPQLAGNAAAGIGQAAGNAVSSLLSSATQAIQCSLPFANCGPNTGGEVFAQCTAPNGRPSPRCKAYPSVDDAAAAALVLARLGTKCSAENQTGTATRAKEYAGLIYTRNKQFFFVGPFVGQDVKADFTVSVYVLETKLKILATEVEGAYHSHPPGSTVTFSLADMATAVKFNKPSYIVGTNFAGDGEVAKFTPSTTSVPQGWESGWVSLRELWFDWRNTSPLGDVVPMGDLGANGKLVNWTQQCPTQVF